MISVYYAIFHSQILYGCSSWSLTTKKNFNKINVLQKKCLRIINFKPFNADTINLFSSNKINKLEDIVSIEQINLAFQYKNNLLPEDLMSLFHSNNYIYYTRNMKKGGLLLPHIKTLSYGERSIKFAIPSEWNEFIKSNVFNHFKTPKFLRGFL